MVFGLKSKEKKGTETDKKLIAKRVFGVPLNIAVANDPVSSDVRVPKFVYDCIKYVEENGLDVEGIYRVSASKSKLDELEKLADSGVILTFTDTHHSAGLLKRFLRQLPEHILPNQQRQLIEETANRCSCPSDSACRCDSVIQLYEQLQSLPIENLHLLSIVFLHSQNVVKHNSSNKMNLAALGVLLQAMLNMPKQLVRILLMNAASNFETEKVFELFKDESIRRLFQYTSTPLDKLGPQEYNIQGDTQPPPAYFEKQLLALHTSLKLEVEEEKRKITQLLGNLRYVRSLIPEETLISIDSQHKSTSSTESNLPDTPTKNNQELNELEKRRDELLAEVSKYRDLCGQLRARLEQYNMLLSVAHAKNEIHENVQDSLLVTRF